MKLSPTKLALLRAFANEQEQSGWKHGAGTLSWAKKLGYVQMTTDSPRMYRITEAGRAALEGAEQAMGELS